MHDETVKHLMNVTENNVQLIEDLLRNNRTVQLFELILTTIATISESNTRLLKENNYVLNFVQEETIEIFMNISRGDA